jgi:selenocysteine lyase/cysteine desulfurase
MNRKLQPQMAARATIVGSQACSGTLAWSVVVTVLTPDILHYNPDISYTFARHRAAPVRNGQEVAVAVPAGEDAVMGVFDVVAVRKQFPALDEGAAHFDGPGGSQTPQVVADAVATTMTSAMANRGTLTAAERRADETVVAAREAMADLLGTDPHGIVFGRSMTQLTYDFSRTLAKAWGPGDEVVVTRLDHDANVRPWVQAAEAVGATVRWLSFDPETSELDDIAPLLNDRTRLVAVTGASNLLGTRPDTVRIADLVHQAGALLYVDGVHLTAHAPVDASYADF